MSIAAAKGLNADDAIRLAKQYFDQFFGESNARNVLLEGLEFDEDRDAWLITIGFDVGREKYRSPSVNALAMFEQKEFEPIRETRQFLISDSDKALISMRIG
tara:strand:+ start:243 stop:548 length:306 start_codon:yes stop_codon:yes gene_type:complete